MDIYTPEQQVIERRCWKIRFINICIPNQGPLSSRNLIAQVWLVPTVNGVTDETVNETNGIPLGEWRISLAEVIAAVFKRDAPAASLEEFGALQFAADLEVILCSLWPARLAELKKMIRENAPTALSARAIEALGINDEVEVGDGLGSPAST